MLTDYLPDATALDRPFWDGTCEGRILIQRCEACDRPNFPARPYCPHCHQDRLVWVPASGEGTVASWSAVYIAPDATFDAPLPYLLATVRLTEGVQMMSTLVGCREADLHVGFPVTVTFETRSSFRIPQFKPANPGRLTGPDNETMADDQLSFREDRQ